MSLHCCGAFWNTFSSSIEGNVQFLISFQTITFNNNSTDFSSLLPRGKPLHLSKFPFCAGSSLRRKQWFIHNCWSCRCLCMSLCLIAVYKPGWRSYYHLSSPTGTRDKSGHALVTVTPRNTIWLNPSCNSDELVRIIMYFYTILRYCHHLLSTSISLTILMSNVFIHSFD